MTSTPSTRAVGSMSPRIAARPRRWRLIDPTWARILQPAQAATAACELGG